MPINPAAVKKTSMFKTANDLCDVASVIVYCESDGTMLLLVEPAPSEFWIPSTRVPEGTSWLQQMGTDLLPDIFGGVAPPSRLLRLNKFWIPHHSTPYICHAVFEIRINGEAKKKLKVIYGKLKGKVRWANEDDLIKFGQSKSLKSPELVEYMNILQSKAYITTNIPNEHFVVGNFLETNENILVSGKGNLYEQIVDVSGIDREAQTILYKEFLLMSFPGNFMSLQVFTKFLLDIGWTKEEAPFLFYSADVSNRGGLCYREFLYFLAATEPGGSYGGGPAELRCRFMFRYLDTDKNSLLKREEMRHFITLVRKARKLPLDPPKIDKDLQDCYKAIGILDSQAMNVTDFLKAVGELKIRGTSQIYRAPHSIQKYIKEMIDRSSRIRPQVGSTRTQSSTDAKGSSKDGAYEMAVHTIKIQRSGNALNVENLWKIENSTSHSSGVPKPLNEITRKKSTDQFDQQSKSNELLRELRYLTQVNKKMQSYGKLETLTLNWGQLDPAAVARNLVNVCNDVREIFLKEPRMLTINSPVYIMGDLHGNFADLLYFEKILWHVGPGLCPCNLLFLGDYVDRGLFSVEVISYLFAYKLQSPNKVKLLRGNHEIKRVQQQWTFEKECKLKFGDKLGTLVFNSINDAFDTMPLAAVIDGRVFCCHGGIPPPWLCPVAAAINDIPAVLNDPQDQSSLAWELMWNDPIRGKTINEKIAMELLANEGFAVNSRRGTAHIFSVEALEKFLHANGFTHLVRAHEVVESGFYLQQKGRLLTVFSSSKYCGGQNVAACILADQGKLRILRIDTE